MTPRLIAGALAPVLSVFASCARPDHAEHWPDRFLLSAGPQPGFAIKRVIERQPPATLVGDDGSVCRTSRERFDHTREGRWIACLWNLPTLDSAQTTDPDTQSDGSQVAVRH
jgi:hypothetical protein